MVNFPHQAIVQMFHLNYISSEMLQKLRNTLAHFIINVKEPSSTFQRALQKLNSQQMTNQLQREETEFNNIRIGKLKLSVSLPKPANEERIVSPTERLGETG